MLIRWGEALGPCEGLQAYFPEEQPCGTPSSAQLKEPTKGFKSLPKQTFGSFIPPLPN